MVIKSLATALIIIVFFTGCVATNPQKPRQALESVTFTDTETFDRDVADSMSANVAAITVTPVAPISMNQMPERLSKWLGAVADKQGKVELDPKPNTKSLSLILSLLPIVYDFLMAQSSPYELAKNYDVTVAYQPETGAVKNLVFRKKIQK